MFLFRCRVDSAGLGWLLRPAVAGEMGEEASGPELLGVVGFGTGLGGHDSGGYDHSDKSEGDQKVMHDEFSLCGSSEPAYEKMIGWIGIYLNTTSIPLVMGRGAGGVTRRW
jgi:hypothetical protein